MSTSQVQQQRTRSGSMNAAVDSLFGEAADEDFFSTLGANNQNKSVSNSVSELFWINKFRTNVYIP